MKFLMLGPSAIFPLYIFCIYGCAFGETAIQFFVKSPQSYLKSSSSCFKTRILRRNAENHGSYCRLQIILDYKTSIEIEVTKVKIQGACGC